MPNNVDDLNKRPEALNLITIFSDLNGNTIDKTLSQFRGKEFSHFKNNLADVLIENICSIEKINELMSDKRHLEAVLKKGKQEANIIAEENLKKIRDIVGFL